jgi:hypothetical protein
MSLEPLELAEISLLTSLKCYKILQEEAAHYGLTEREYARVAFELGLRQLDQQTVAKEITAFAKEYGSTEWDFDPDVAAAGAEVILAEPSGFEKFIPEHLKRELP